MCSLYCGKQITVIYKIYPCHHQLLLKNFIFYENYFLTELNLNLNNPLQLKMCTYFVDEILQIVHIKSFLLIYSFSVTIFVPFPQCFYYCHVVFFIIFFCNKLTKNKVKEL